MDVVSMLRGAVWLLAVGAVGGVAMALIRFLRKENPPAWLTMLHGVLTAAGLTLVAYGVFVFGQPASAGWALTLFAIAGLGGVTLNLAYQEKRLLLPAWLVIVHALIAVAGFVVLCVAAFVD
jgi:hypothetical protein